MQILSLVREEGNPFPLTSWILTSPPGPLYCLFDTHRHNTVSNGVRTPVALDDNQEAENGDADRCLGVRCSRDMGRSRPGGQVRQVPRRSDAGQRKRQFHRRQVRSDAQEGRRGHRLLSLAAELEVLRHESEFAVQHERELLPRGIEIPGDGGPPDARLRLVPAPDVPNPAPDGLGRQRHGIQADPGTGPGLQTDQYNFNPNTQREFSDREWKLTPVRER